MWSLGIICVVLLLQFQCAGAKRGRSRAAIAKIQERVCTSRGGQCGQPNVTCAGLALSMTCANGIHCCYKTPAEVRLTDGLDNATGFVQVHKDGKWLHLSTRFPVAPFSVCKQVGLTGGKAVLVQTLLTFKDQKTKSECVDHDRKCTNSNCLKHVKCWNAQRMHIGCNGDPAIRMWQESLKHPELRWNSKEGLPEMKYLGKWNRMCVFYSPQSTLPPLLCKGLGYKYGALISKVSKFNGLSLAIPDRCFPNASSFGECLGPKPLQAAQCHLRLQLVCRNDQLEPAKLRMVPIPELQDNSTGLVNIFKDGKWMNISRNGFSKSDIKWMCYSYQTSLPATVTLSQMDIRQRDSLCLQRGTSCKNIPFLAECFSPRKKKCSSDELLVLGCKGDPAPKKLWDRFVKDPKFRLSTSQSGLEMFYDKTWQGLCLFDHSFADIMCHELGYSKGKLKAFRRQKGDKSTMMCLPGRSRRVQDMNLNYMLSRPPSVIRCRHKLTCTGKKKEKKGGNVDKKGQIKSESKEEKKANLADQASNYVKVECDSTSFRLSVNYAVLKSHHPKLKTKHLHLVDKSCVLKNSKDGKLLFHKFKLNACGTKQKMNATDLIYFNQLIYTGHKASKPFKIDLQCIVPRSASVKKNVNFVRNSHIVITGKGNMFMNIDVFDDKNFKNRITTHPITVPRQKPLYVDIWMKSTDPTLSVALTDCTAMGVNKKVAEVSLISKGCPVLPNTKYFPWKKDRVRFSLLCDDALTHLKTMHLKCNVKVCSSFKKDRTCVMPKCPTSDI